MQETAKDRLILFIKHLGIGQAKFEAKVGLSNGYVNKLKKAPSTDKLQLIADAYPEINAMWLMTGEGSMLNKDSFREMEEQSVKDRLIAFLEYEGVNKSEFGRRIGVSSAFISSMRKSMQPDKIKLIQSEFPNLNIDWLLTGEGSMLNEDSRRDVEVLTNTEFQELKSTTEEGGISLVPLIHIDSVGGMRSLNTISSSEQYVDRMVPFPDARPDDVAILQSGNSMAPTIPAGAILQIRRVDGWREYFGYGNDFVLWLDDDRRITKQVLKYEPDPKNYVMSHSYNLEAADEELPKSMIKEVWKVINVLINKGW